MSTFGYGMVGLAVFVLVFGAVWIFLANNSIPHPAWLKWMVELDNPFTKINRAKNIIEHLKLSPGMKVLDAGCGPGRLSIPLAQQVGPQGEVTALDIQEEMLNRVKEKATGAGLHNIRFVNAKLGEGSLDKNYYDKALLVTVLGEIPDQTGALKEIFDALKVGGILSVTEVIFDPQFQRKTKVKSLAESVGFIEKAVWGNSIAFTMHFEKLTH